MLKLRGQHLDAFRRGAFSNFQRRALNHLREYVPEPTKSLTDDQLLQRIDECIPRANRYDLATERQVMAFVDTTYWLEEHFDTDPNHDWSQMVLRSPRFEPDEKAVALAAIARSVYEARRSAV